MVANVETMAWTNEVPWHGLGERVDDTATVAQMLKKAGLNWKVERAPMFLEGGVEVKDFAALRRSSDGSVLDVVGSRYKPTQNEEVFEFFKEFVEAGKAKMETAGSLAGGRYVWGLANLKDQFKLGSSDIVKGYLLAAIPHQQGKSLLLKQTSVRVVCQNTLHLALRKEEGAPEFRMNHRNEFNESMMNTAKEVLGLARDKLHEFEKIAQQLLKLKLGKDDVIRLLQPVFQHDLGETTMKQYLGKFEDEANKKMDLVMQAYEKAPGATPGNGWGVLNAVTYYADHMASRTTDKRLTNAWMGKTANQKEKVLAALLEKAA